MAVDFDDVVDVAAPTKDRAKPVVENASIFGRLAEPNAMNAAANANDGTIFEG